MNDELLSMVRDTKDRLTSMSEGVYMLDSARATMRRTTRAVIIVLAITAVVSILSLLSTLASLAARPTLKDLSVSLESQLDEICSGDTLPVTVNLYSARPGTLARVYYTVQDAETDRTVIPDTDGPSVNLWRRAGFRQRVIQYHLPDTIPPGNYLLRVGIDQDERTAIMGDLPFTVLDCQ